MTIFLHNSIIRQQFKKVSSMYGEEILELFLSFYKMLPSVAKRGKQVSLLFENIHCITYISLLKSLK